MELLSNIPGLNGADNMPGVGTIVYAARVRDFNTIATPAEGEVEINANHTFLAGRGFSKIYNTLKTGGIEGDSKGDLDGKYQEFKYEGFIPGIRALIQKFLRQGQNEEWIFLIFHNGNYIQLGSKNLPAYLNLKMRTGKVGADEVAGYMMEITSADISSWFYRGTITEIPSGVITSGASSFTVPAPDAGKVFQAKVLLGNVDIVLASYLCTEEDTQTTLAANIANALDANGIGATSAGVVVSFTGLTDYNGWSVEIVETANVFSGIAKITIGNPGADGDTIVLRVNFAGAPIIIGESFRDTGFTATQVAAALAAACDPNPLDFVVTSSGPDVIVTVPDTEALTFDGAYLYAETSGTMTEIAALAERTF
jgi:hypothetical protein